MVKVIVQDNCLWQGHNRRGSGKKKRTNLNYRRRKLFTSSLRRAIRWEFWPMSVFYVPVVVYIVWLSLRYRGLTFLCCNPGLPMSGLLGERKADSLCQLQPDVVASFELILSNQTLDEKVRQAKSFMYKQALSFPVVLKPNFGDRGFGVSIINNQPELQSYLEQNNQDVLIQEHISGEEFGVFYLRYPEQSQGTIFSITQKTFPILIGDGSSTLEELIFEHPRTHYMARYLLKLHEDNLHKVLTENEEFQSVEIGTHSRGSLFLEGGHNITEELTRRVDQVSKQIDGFYFGRYDVRVPKVDDLRLGKNLKVLEVNGVTSEASNIYDPKHSVFYAYKILFRQWRAAFEIGHQNTQFGGQKAIKKVEIKQLLAHLKAVYGN